MKKTTAYLAISFFMAPIVFVIGVMVVGTFMAIFPNLEAVLWGLGISAIIVLWFISGHYGLKYIHTKTLERLDSKP
jgi:arginine exporter protein ArgO